MESNISRKLKKDLNSIRDLPGLIVKMQADGLLNQLENVFSYIYDTSELPDDLYKENFKIILNQIIETAWDQESKSKNL